MSQTLLISFADFEPFKAIAVSVNAREKVEPIILEAQQFDLRPKLGEALYYALLADYDATPQLAVYGDLYNGATYTDIHGNTVKWEGLKALLAYYTYARYVNTSHINATPFGIVQKAAEHTEQISDDARKQLYRQAIAGAESYAAQMFAFLERKRAANATGYSLWNSGQSNSANRTMPRVRKIGP